MNYSIQLFEKSFVHGTVKRGQPIRRSMIKSIRMGISMSQRNVEIVSKLGTEMRPSSKCFRSS